MKPSFMPFANQRDIPFVLPLASGQAMTLEAEARPRALWVHEGRVWLTARSAAEPTADVWLQAGQTLALPAGSEWVIEAWPAARVSLLQAAPTALRRASSPWRAALAAWRHGSWTTSQPA